MITQDMTSSLYIVRGAAGAHPGAPTAPVTDARLPAASRGKRQLRTATLAARAWYQRTSTPLRA